MIEALKGTPGTPSFKFQISVVAMILLLAAALRVHELTRHALWSDEIYTMQSSAGFGLESKRLAGAGLLEPPPDLLSLTPQRPWWTLATSLARDDNHPPLYFLLVRAWREVFGDSDAALRGLSVLCSVAAIAFLFDATRHLHDVTTALWAALLMALAMPPNSVRPGSPVRTALMLM